MEKPVSVSPARKKSDGSVLVFRSVSVQSSEIVQGFRVRPALLMVKVLLAVPVKLPLPVTVTVTVPALMQSSL